MAIAHRTRKGGPVVTTWRVGGRHHQEVVAVGVPLDDHFVQNASRCHPKRRTIERGSALNVPTKNVLNTTPFQPPCSRDFTGKRSSTMRTSRKWRKSVRNSAAVYLRSTGA